MSDAREAIAADRFAEFREAKLRGWGKVAGQSPEPTT
jgi:hypothetical protein